MPRFPAAEWRAQTTRLTVFPMPDATARSADWWEAVTGDQPEETKMNPKKRSALISGMVDPGKLILGLDVDRIDWVLQAPEPHLEELATAREFPVLGRAMEVFDAFSAMVQTWLARDDLPAIGRMAFGAVLVHPEADRRAGYVRLPDYVPVQVDPESTDFLYQVNLPRLPSATGIEGLYLNRLSKWSVSLWKSVSLRFSGAAVQAQAVPEAFALRVELDINTVPSFEGLIPPARLVDVYRELLATGSTIAANGVAQ